MLGSFYSVLSSLTILISLRLATFARHLPEPIGEQTGYPIMVKYRPSVDPMLAEKLAKVAHKATQDGARSGTERRAPSASASCLWTEGETDWLDPSDPLAIPMPSPQSDLGESGSGTQAGEMTLLQIMVTIKSCHAALSTQIETIRVDFALLKDNVHKVRQRFTQTEQRISAAYPMVFCTRPSCESYIKARHNSSCHPRKQITDWSPRDLDNTFALTPDKYVP